MGDSTRAILTANFLAHFEDGFMEHAFTKLNRKTLKTAIALACSRYAQKFEPGVFQ